MAPSAESSFTQLPLAELTTADGQRIRTRTDLLAARRGRDHEDLLKFAPTDAGKPHRAAFVRGPPPPGFSSFEALRNSRRTNTEHFTHFQEHVAPPPRARARPKTTIVTDKITDLPPPAFEDAAPCWRFGRKRAPNNALEIACRLEAPELRAPHTAPLGSSFSATGLFTPEESKPLRSFYRKPNTLSLRDRPPWVN